MPVDYETIQKIQKLGDDVLSGVSEVAALMGFSVLTVRQRKLPGLEPVPGLSRLRWRLGDLRAWMRTGNAAPPSSPLHDKRLIKTQKHREANQESAGGGATMIVLYVIPVRLHQEP